MHNDSIWANYALDQHTAKHIVLVKRLKVFKIGAVVTLKAFDIEDKCITNFIALLCDVNHYYEK